MLSRLVGACCSIRADWLGVGLFASLSPSKRMVALDFHANTEKRDQMNKRERFQVPTATLDKRFLDRIPKCGTSWCAHKIR